MASPGQSARNLILAAFLDVLKGIRVESGYATSPAVVTRNYIPVDEVTEWPTLCVIEGAKSSAMSFINNEYQHSFTVAVHGYVQASEGRTRSEWLEDLWDDVKLALLGNGHWRLTVGGADLTQNLVFEERLTDGGAFEPLGAFAQDVQVLYNEAIPGG